MSHRTASLGLFVVVSTAAHASGDPAAVGIAAAMIAVASSAVWGLLTGVTFALLKQTLLNGYLTACVPGVLFGVAFLVYLMDSPFEINVAILFGTMLVAASALYMLAYSLLRVIARARNEERSNP